MRVFITGHQGLGNRGCEALLRSTVHIIRARHPQARFHVPSVHPQADQAQWPQAPDLGVQWIRAPQPGAGLVNWARACRLWPSLARVPWPLPVLSGEESDALRHSDVLLSIGGDNLTLDYGLSSLALYAGMAEQAMKMGVPAVLWGASVGPFDTWPAVQGRMQTHLQRLAALTVRESGSLRILSELGLPTEQDAQAGPLRVLSVTDPAFTLVPQPVDLQPHLPCPQGADGPLVGLNLSPLAAVRRAGESRLQARQRVVQAGVSLIHHVLRERAGRVLLVPHVSARDAAGQCVHRIAPELDDAWLLEEVQARVNEPHRIRQLPTWNAAALKHAIAQCDTFIGARTHSVIAALSSGVPALSLSYSLKARGIHRDLLGDESGVLDGRRLDGPALVDAWQALHQRSDLERQVLALRAREWKDRARDGARILDAARFDHAPHALSP